MNNCVKIHGTVIDCPIWGESHAVRLAWITLLALADEHGVVRGSVGELAGRAHLSGAEMVRALAVLMAADPGDSSGIDEGRRVRILGGGEWQIVNAERFRDIRTERNERNAERQRRYRAKWRAERERRLADQSGQQKRLGEWLEWAGARPSFPPKPGRVPPT